MVPNASPKEPASEPVAIQRVAVDRLAGSVVHAVLAQQKTRSSFPAQIILVGQPTWVVNKLFTP